MAVQLETLAFAVDSSGVVRGVREIDAALEKMERRIDAASNRLRGLGSGSTGGLRTPRAPNPEQEFVKLAQAQARLQAASGNLAQAEATLQRALEGVNKETLSGLRVQTQLATVQARIRRELAQTGQQSKVTSEIIREGFSEALEELIGDGSIANELTKVFFKLPTQAKIAIGAVSAAAIAGAVALGTMVVAANKILDTTEKLTTKSKEDFDKYSKGINGAGDEVTKLDRQLATDLQRSLGLVKGAADAMFLNLLRESGPELNTLLKTTANFLVQMIPVAQRFGNILSEAFNFGSAALRTFVQTRQLIATALSNPTVGIGLLGSLGVDAFKNNLDQVRRENAASEQELPKIKLPGFKVSGGKRPDTELEQLTKRFAEVNKEIRELQERSSREYKLKVQIEGAEGVRTLIDDLLKIQTELGIRSQLPTSRRVQTAPGKFRNILDVDEARRQLEAFQQLKDQPTSNAFAGLLGGVGKIEAGIDDTRFKRLIDEAEKQLKSQASAIEKTTETVEKAIRSAQEFDDFLADTTSNLEDELQSIGRPQTREESLRRALRQRNADLTSPASLDALAKARQVDQAAQEFDRYSAAVEESTRRTEEFRSTVQGLFETLLDSPRRVFDELIRLGKRFASQFLTNLVFGGNGGGPGGGGGGFLGGGAGGGQAGGGGLFGAIGSAITGRLGGFTTGGFAGGPGAGGVLGGGGGFNLGGGLFSGLLGKGIGALGRLFGFGGGGGASKIASAAVNAAKGGGAAASGGSGFLSALGFSNPLSAVITGGLIAAPFVAKLFGGLFGGGTEKELGRAIQGEYGLRTEREIQRAIKGIGDAEFRGSGGAKRNINATIKLRPSKEALYEYALSTGQTGSRLVREFELERTLGNPFAASNRFVKRATGGAVFPGTDYLVGDGGRPEVVRVSAPGYVYPSLSDYAGRANGGDPLTRQAMVAVMAELSELRAVLGNLRGIKPGAVLAMGAAEAPQVLAAGARAGFGQSQPELAALNTLQGY